MSTNRASSNDGRQDEDETDKQAGGIIRRNRSNKMTSHSFSSRTNDGNNYEDNFKNTPPEEYRYNKNNVVENAVTTTINSHHHLPRRRRKREEPSSGSSSRRSSSESSNLSSEPVITSLANISYTDTESTMEAHNEIDSVRIDIDGYVGGDDEDCHDYDGDEDDGRGNTAIVKSIGDDGIFDGGTTTVNGTMEVEKTEKGATSTITNEVTPRTPPSSPPPSDSAEEESATPRRRTSWKRTGNDGSLLPLSTEDASSSGKGISGSTKKLNGASIDSNAGKSDLLSSSSAAAPVSSSPPLSPAAPSLPSSPSSPPPVSPPASASLSSPSSNTPRSPSPLPMTIPPPSLTPSPPPSPLQEAAAEESNVTAAPIMMTRSDSAPPALSGDDSPSPLSKQQQNGKMTQKNFQNLEHSKDAAAAGRQQHSNATTQTSAAHKPLHPGAPAPAPTATQGVSLSSAEHLLYHPQQQHAKSTPTAAKTTATGTTKSSSPPSSANATNQSSKNTPPHTPPHATTAGTPPTSVSNNLTKKQQQQNQQHQQQQQQQQLYKETTRRPLPPPLFPNTIKSPRDQHDIVERSPRDRYVRFAEKLGSGAYKIVYRAYDTIEGIEVAWNVVKLAGVPKTERNRIVNEVQLLQRLHHVNIISFHGSWVNREKEQVIFVTEILSSGTLKSFVDKVQVIRWRIAKRWAIQILKGLEYMHSLDPPIIHRDLKCDNIFINGTSGDLRIGDLGLSTMISKNKALSVLGTPEFMAPELYDEVYDEKVDIYAFGMCLLEIFTKEIPYRECSNPAQIYKKVTNGIMPESLLRVRNLEAKEFIMLCLGKRESRPSASELLRHPFLAKKSDDDTEVEVDPPMQETAINEVSDADLSSRGSSADKLHDTINEVHHQGQNMPHRTHGVDSGALSSAPLPAQQVQSSTHTSDDDESDHFSAMPDIETNINKVKVFMGRGQEIQNDDDDDGDAQPISNTGTSEGRARAGESPTENRANEDDGGQGAQSGKSSGGAMAGGGASQEPEPQYLVAAAVIETAEGERPYPDDILKLNFTLPLEGQTQTVQFDFHLVEDDPIEVAKEMVSELEIPQGAVLEISETISRQARNARMKLGRFNQEQQRLLMQQQQQQQHHLLAQHQVMHQQAQQPGIMMQPSLVGTASDNSSKQQTLTPQVGNNIHVFQPNSDNYVLGGVTVPNAMHHNLGGQVMQPHIAGGTNLSVPLPQASATMQHQQQQHPVAPTAMGGIQGNNTASHIARPPILPSVPESNVTSNSQGSEPSSSQEHLQMNEPLAGSSQSKQGYMASGSAPVTGQPLQQVKHQVQQTNVPQQVAQVEAEEEDDGVVSESSDDESMQEENSEELRKLEEDFQKNIMRAKKAYYTRMDNLQRSKEEKEAQHLKTLEKHEKEKADFEKRVKLAEAEQNRRLEQLEQEHARQRAATLEKAKLERDGINTREAHAKVKRKHQTAAGNMNLDATVSQLADSISGSFSVAQGGKTRSGSSSGLSSSDDSSRGSTV